MNILWNILGGLAFALNERDRACASRRVRARMGRGDGRERTCGVTTTEPTIPVIREALAAHAMFLSLDFAAEDIYLRPLPDRVVVTVRRAGLEFNCDVGTHDLDEKTIVSQWKDAAAWWNTLDAEQRRKFLDTSDTRKNYVPIIVALLERGFSL